MSSDATPVRGDGVDGTVARTLAPRSDAANNLIAAETDEEAVRAWLRARAGRSRATFDRYQREARRYVQFLQARGVELQSVQLNHIEAYEELMLAGDDNRAARGPAAVDAAFKVLQAMHAFLAATGYLDRNVLLLRERRTQESDTQLERYLTDAEIDAVLAEASELGKVEAGEGIEATRSARTRFLLVWFLSTGARISEALGARMQDIYATGDAQWHWRIRRKGGKVADIPLRDDAMRALTHYRAQLGLPPYPVSVDDEGFLVWPLRGRSTRALHRSTIGPDLRAFFERAARRLEDQRLAAHLRQATAHWLRHTAVTQLLDAGVSMRVVSRLLGHANQGITSQIYDHIQRERWRDEMEQGRGYWV